MAEMNRVLLAFRTEPTNGNISSCINKIMNTLAFRKLSEKTQVILSLSGPDVRTRLTHTIEVAKIARDICDDLGLNAELAEAIALAHDIGHTPFGHVGERTLREIMCGCDTLDGKVEDYDFDNTGFKHNLQSFRVLHTIEVLPDGDAAWPYILWGAIDHTKLSYAKPCSDMENEIYISCQHCDCVYNCYFHAKKECKRNVLNRQKADPSKRICKPWYCANLEVVETKEDCLEYEKNYQDKYEVKSRFLWDELIDNKYFKIKHVDDIFCNGPCYMARLWKHKLDNEDLVNKYKFLFDHPFPNSFYSKKMFDYFFDENINKNGWISVEAQIVKQADEIAQRQEDLEDGITKGLISLEYAQLKLRELINKIKFNGKRSLIKKIDAANNPDKIGALIVEFYSNLLKESTVYNFNNFVDSKDKGKLNIYCMLNIILLMDKDKRKKWILQELTNIPKSTIGRESIRENHLTEYFDIDVSNHNLLFIVYDYLDSLLKTRSSTDKTDDEIIDKYINLLEIHEEEVVKKYYTAKSEGIRYAISLNRIKLIDAIREHLKKSFPDMFNEFFVNDKKEWKWKFEHLNMRQFYALQKVYGEHVHSGHALKCVDDLIDLLNSSFIFPKYTTHVKSECFSSWRNFNKEESKQVLSKLVSFSKHNPFHKNNKKALDNFNEETGKIILKSEIVEKHDGKATFILKRLFKAYIDNAHQLPDHGLKNIFFTFKDKNEEFMVSEKITFIGVLNKFRKTLSYNSTESRAIVDNIISKNFLEFTANDFEYLKEGTSNEIKSLLSSKEELINFLKKYIVSNENITSAHRNEFVKGSPILSKVLKEFRRVMDNSILNATPLWKSILTRGICDYIASLTDQEAIDEYEKLYAGVMEIV